MTTLHFPRPRRYEADGEGTWRLTAGTRVILPEGGAMTRTLARLGEEYPLLAAAEKVEGGPARPGDLEIRLGEAEEEGFILRVGPVLELTARTVRGALYGLRSILEAEDGLAYGRYEDWPDTGERGLHLDAGRKFYTKEWIMERVRDMSRNRMNTLWFHFSETEGFRIACDSHPEVPSLLHHSKEDVREIIRLCEDLCIEINPALDCPGHLGQALQEHPRWQLPREMAEPLHSALNITLPEARRFLLDLIDEYAELFAGSKVFHIGGDEFIDFNHFERFPVMEAYAKEHLGPECGGVDVYIDFLNQVIAHVRAKGFQVRVWNDGLFRPGLEQHIELDRDVQIAYWTNWDKGMAPLKTFLDKGYRVVNYDWRYLYYILLIRSDYTDPDPERLLGEWTPDHFPESPVVGPQSCPPEQAEQVLGCCYSIWSDWPDLQEEEEVHARSKDSIRAFAIRCWQKKA